MPKSIGDIKNSLDCQLGTELYLKRMVDVKTIERSGVLKETYPSVFIVELDQDIYNFERVSYTYTDVLTENVQVSFEGDNHQKLIAH
ncbi:hypothetical protein J4710_06610 [Staphylococcus xylosus]|uniref:Veg protein n=1 Tax=Staphylococcus xylosus TaxID=1288 RepID=A0A939NDC6_STAXY|nr:hypothetical protein [Staphylococcus xylosus]